MNKEEKEIIERIEDTFYSNTGKEIKHFQKVTLYEEGITDILKLLNFVEKQQKELEQKESILDKVTEELKEEANQKIPLAEDMDWGICRKQYAREILNIIKGEKKEAEQY